MPGQLTGSGIRSVNFWYPRRGQLKGRVADQPVVLIPIIGTGSVASSDFPPRFWLGRHRLAMFSVAGTFVAEFTEDQDSGTGFPRSRRLLLPGDYASVFKKNVRVSDRFWTILAAKGSGEHARLGLAIAKKRAKRAVDRNRIKRIAREYFRVHGEELNVIDLVVMNRDAATTASSEELRRSLDALWLKLRNKCK